MAVLGLNLVNSTLIAELLFYCLGELEVFAFGVCLKLDAHEGRSLGHTLGVCLEYLASFSFWGRKREVFDKISDREECLPKPFFM
jgi:hypothetical protein